MFNLINLRKTSETPEFPLGVPKVNPYLFLANDGTISQISGKTEAMKFLSLARENKGTIVAGWVGQWRTDMFQVDDLDAWHYSMLTDRERAALN